VQETDWVDVESDNGEIFSNPAVLQAVFSDDVLLDGLNSEVIELSNRRIIALRVLDSEGPRPKTFEDVSEEVLGILQTERAAEQLDTLVAALQEKIVAGEDVQALADAEDVAEATIGEVLTRQVGAVDRDVVSAVYAAAKPSDGVAVVNTVTASNGDRVVYALRSVDVPEADDDAQPAAAVVNTQGGNNDFNAMVQAMRASASIELSDLADIVPGGLICFDQYLTANYTA